MTEAVPAAGEPVQQMFGGMPTRLYAASPSRLLAWLDCPRRYRMTYLDRPRPPARPQRAHTSIGVATHNALRDYWDLAPADRSAAAAPGLVRRAWVDAGFRDPEQSVRWRARVGGPGEPLPRGCRPARGAAGHRAHGVAAHAHARPHRPDRPPRRPWRAAARGRLQDQPAPRPPTTTPAPRCRSPSTPSPPRGCSGPLHPGRAAPRAERPGGRAHPHPGVAGPQAGRGRVDRRRPASGPTPTSPSVGPESTRFAPRTSPLCTWCDFRAHCPEGQRVGPEKSSWAALEGEDA